MNRLPPELLTRVFDLAVDHGSEEHAKQVIPLTHVCRYWRTVLLSYPGMWSTVYMKPGDPTVISEWLARSQKVPLTVVAEFSDSYEHPPCRYQDLATATLAGSNDPGLCPRHQAVLSLDQLLPHRSRIRDLSIRLDSSNPYWNDPEDEGHEGEPTLLYHHFFRGTLPNLQHLDFRAAHVQRRRFMIPIPEPLFVGGLPRLKKLKYLGVTPGLTGMVKNLASCEIGNWSRTAGITFLHPNELQVFFNNNKNVESLTLGDNCEVFHDEPWVPIAIPMTDLKFLKIQCWSSREIEKFLNFIHAPQFKNLDTVQLSRSALRGVQAVVTDGSGHAFQFSYYEDEATPHPVRHFGTAITTLRLDQGMTLNSASHLRDLFWSLDAVQALEFNGTIADFVQDVLSETELFLELRVIRVAVSRGDCKRTLRLLAIASKRRMEEGNPLTTIEPLLVEGKDRLDQSLRVEWEEGYKRRT